MAVQEIDSMPIACAPVSKSAASSTAPRVAPCGRRPTPSSPLEWRSTNAAATSRKLHHKLMVIDDSVTIIGSFNYQAGQPL
jgi:phosphatidylserine/phosphatidylglycerophosphate/cardiolipin synthase-like enzyme